MAKNKSNSKGPGIMSWAKIGFGISLGSALAFMIYMALAVCLFVPGFILVKKESKKEKKDRKMGLVILGFILMALGMIFGLGFGASFFFQLLGESV